jgi:hypothetical protein
MPLGHLERNGRYTSAHANVIPDIASSGVKFRRWFVYGALSKAEMDARSLSEGRSVVRNLPDRPAKTLIWDLSDARKIQQPTTKFLIDSLLALKQCPAFAVRNVYESEVCGSPD